MADYVRTQQRGVPDAMQTRYRDMGDGTHAELLAAYVTNALTAAISGAVDDSGFIATQAGNGF